MNRILLLPALFIASPALAHHPTGGEAPQTVFHGLISGLAHPVIGLDHLAFIVLIGLAAALSGRILAVPGVFIGATLLGTTLHLAGMTLPLAEWIILASVLGLGAVLVMGRTVAGPVAFGGVALAGVFHGWAYGAAVVGSTSMPIFAYLLGFGIIQFAIATGVAVMAGLLMQRDAAPARLAAAVCLGVGLVSLFDAVEPMLLA